MARTCIMMFSGGLDSVVASHVLVSQGVTLEALHFVLPFDSWLGNSHASVRRRAEKIGVPLTIIEEGEEYLPVLKSPAYGFGRNANPCIDCRIHRLKRAHAIMLQRKADFIATGEVVGQRPMSQRMDTMRTIQNRAGLKGLLLRPLSAKLLEPTVPELEGWVDRERLLDLSGRTRKPQMAYAARHGLEYGTPAGGCILTNEQTAVRLRDLERYKPDYTVEDLRMLVHGRRFRLSPRLVLTVGRNADENRVLGESAQAGDWAIELAAIRGPLGVARGDAGEQELSRCGAIVARYSRRAVQAGRVGVVVRHAGVSSEIEVVPAGEEECNALRVT